MLATRFWNVFIALLLGAAIFVLFLATSMYNRAGSRGLGEALSSDSQFVAWYLKDDARQRSARLIQFTLEPDVAKFLQRSSESESKVPEEAKNRLLSALKKAAAQIPKEAAFDAVFAVDQHGRVVAHLGYEQATGMENFELGGYPVVADALRGYLRDDTLVLDRIYRVVARPVEYDLSQPPAGAIVGARIIDDRFARELSERTGAAIAFYTQGQRAASGAPEGFNSGQLDQIVGDLEDLKADKDYQEKGRSRVRVIGGMLSVQYSRLLGEAWTLDSGYAVARRPFGVSGPLDFFSQADDKDKERGRLWLAALIALLAAGVGIAFTLLEHTRPLAAFQAEAQRFAKGEVDHLQPSRFGGLFRKIASDVNDGVDRALARGGGPRRGPADLQEVLGDLPAEPQMSAFSLPNDAGAASGPMSGAGIAPPVSSQQRPLPGPPPRVPKPPPGPRPGAFGIEEPAAEPEADEPLSIPASSQMAAQMATSGLGTSTGDAQAETAEWRRVYEDFLELKRQCGENVDGFTFEKFEQTLTKRKGALMKQHGASQVKFSVYVKDGKAALKASPLRN
jgi:hypothetical protein